MVYQPVLGKPYMEPNIFVCNKCTGMVDDFIYLGSTLTRICTLTNEVLRSIQKASNVFGKLDK